MGVGLGYAIAAAVESGSPVVAVEGDSALDSVDGNRDYLSYQLQSL